MHPLWRRISAFAIIVAVGGPETRAASIANQVRTIFQPDQAARAALAPDGRHVAFVVPDGRGLQIVLCEIDHPEATSRTPLDLRVDAQARFLGWANAAQLVAASDAPVVIAIDAISRAPIRLADVKTEVARGGPWQIRVLGFAPQSECVVLETTRPANAAAVTLEVVDVHWRTGERRVILSQQLPVPGGSVLIDHTGLPRILHSRGEVPQQFRLISGNRKWSEWKPLGPIGVDSTRLTFSVSPRNFHGERALPVGFDFDAATLYVAANSGRDTFGLYAIDRHTGRRPGWAVEEPDCDLIDADDPFAGTALVFDRSRRSLAGVRGHGPTSGTHWLDAEISTVQTVLDEKFPERPVAILEWDDAREIFLVLVASPRDPGRYFIFHRSDGRCVEYFRRGSLEVDDANVTGPFAFTTPAGVRLHGYLTLPQAPRTRKSPLVIWFHDGPWQRVRPGFQRDAQALAALGYAVAQINYRGSSGFGRRHAEAIRAGVDRVPVEDALATIAWLQARDDLDLGRVAAAGEGFGGYLALRATQLHPESFRCAVAWNAPLDVARRSAPDPGAADRQRALDNTFRDRFLSGNGPSPAGGGDDEGVAEITRRAGDLGAEDRDESDSGEVPVPAIAFERQYARWLFELASSETTAVDAPGQVLARPVLLLHDPRHANAPIAPIRRLRDALVRRKQVVELFEIPAQPARDGPGARASLFRRIGEFLDSTVADGSGTSRP